MAEIQPQVHRADVDSEEKENKIDLAPSGFNLALIFMEPVGLARPNDHHDDVRWRLSAELTIDLSPASHSSPGEPELFSLATIYLPALHHRKQAVAIFFWPLGAKFGTAGRVSTIRFRWESDHGRAAARATVLATESAQPSPYCGLFALPFPGTTIVLPFPA